MQLPSAIIAILLTFAVPLATATPSPGYGTPGVIGKINREATADIKARSAPLVAPTDVERELPVMIAARSPGSQTAARLYARGMGKIARRGRVILPPAMEGML
ncbi:hypothetical protein MCOR25_004933 [Pyricularia grisea]|uniref:Uncharacterized protein n=1 Tax=Pyricularia grisea TaxID=148305 RepID=A0A6P8AZV7_PYRGI|nr:hypothetical protein PgNI_10139 [Pyricularia grisea]KAI6367397.1 hypothetical protein MCOR25_004933 [Pyricularia grisea]TLD07857.1 hypothetical protein PgNI_10139 [Pyricularia grisea]